MYRHGEVFFVLIATTTSSGHSSISVGALIGITIAVISAVTIASVVIATVYLVRRLGGSGDRTGETELNTQRRDSNAGVALWMLIVSSGDMNVIAQARAQ
jgi:hypothetical protein